MTISERAARLFELDEASRGLGMQLISCDGGRAVVTMAVLGRMLNGFGTMHGGFIVCVADTAFAMACNESDDVTVAASVDIEFLRPVGAGSVLTATAERRTLAGRSGLYDVRITDESGAVVAEFRGRSRTLAARG
ncbi:MAG TPA: hydroxyphenylacetyl-CoA thioesterase PaaI [Pseudolysinimonas sp.]|jgi:acyl-CoA thioesterase